MASPQKHYKDMKEMIRSLGITIESSEANGNHLKFFVNKDGHRKMFVTARTPSDSRGPLNFKGDIKKWMKGIENDPPR